MYRGPSSLKYWRLNNILTVSQKLVNFAIHKKLKYVDKKCSKRSNAYPGKEC